MMLKGIINLFKTIIDVIARVIAWLLVSLGLWLPAIYSVVFFIVCAITKTSFASIRTLFFMGLVLTAVLSMWYTLSSNKKKKEDKKKSSPNSTFVAKIREKEHKVEFTNVPPNGSAFRPSQEEKEQRQEPPQRQDYNSLKAEYYQERSDCNQKTDDGASREYNGNAESEQQRKIEFQPYNVPKHQPRPAHNDNYYGQQYDNRYYDNRQHDYKRYDNGQQYADRQYDDRRYDDRQQYTDRQYDDRRYNDGRYNDGRYNDGQQYTDSRYEARQHCDSRPQVNQPSKNETPRIFLSRQDSTLLIYEYSDRLDYYRKTRDGIVYDSTKHKH